jgi:hypothetical protein
MEGYIRDKCYFSTVDYGNRISKPWFLNVAQSWREPCEACIILQREADKQVGNDCPKLADYI